MAKLILTLIILALSSLTYSQSLKLDFKSVGDMNNHSSVTLSYKYDSLPYMVSIRLFNTEKNEIQLLKEYLCETKRWHDFTLDVTNLKIGTYTFLVGFGKDQEKQIEFFVWNR